MVGDDPEQRIAELERQLADARRIADLERQLAQARRVAGVQDDVNTPATGFRALPRRDVPPPRDAPPPANLRFGGGTGYGPVGQPDKRLAEPPRRIPVAF